jgi:hypothetical protein
MFRRAGYAMLGLSFVACADRSPTGTGNETDEFSSAPNFAMSAAQAAATGDVASAAVYEGAAAAVRLGARPTQILVSVDGEVSRYDAVVVATWEELSPGDTALRRSLVAWSGGNRPIALLDVSTLGDVGSFGSQYEPASNPRSRAQGTWVNLVRGLRYDATIGEASIVVAQIGEACNLPDGRGKDPRCALADFNIKVDGLFRLGGASPDAGLDAVRIFTEASRVNGVIIARPDARDPRRHPELNRRRLYEQQRDAGRN